jgi:hypothetical protein
MKKLVIGITGGIASGKSEIRRELESLGCLGIDADRIGHEFWNRNLRLRRCAPSLRQPDPLRSKYRKIDRKKKLGQIVFENPAELKWLESVTHPQIIQRINQIIMGTDGSVAFGSHQAERFGTVSALRSKMAGRDGSGNSYGTIDAKKRLHGRCADSNTDATKYGLHRNEMDHIF